MSERISQLRKTAREAERTLLVEALRETEGNQFRAAQLLESSPPTICRKVKELGIEITKKAIIR